MCGPLALLVIATVLNGCFLGHGLDGRDPETPDLPRPPVVDAGATLFFAGQDGDDVHVLALDEATETVTSRSGPLPGLDAAQHHNVTIYTDAAGERLLVRAIREDGEGQQRDTLIAVDDAGSRVLVDDERIWHFKVAPELRAVWIERAEVVGSRAERKQVTVLDFEGRSLFASDYAPWSDLHFVAFAPDGSWWLSLRDGSDLNLSLLDGSEWVIRSYDIPEGTIPYVLRHAFPSSLILTDEYPGVTWVDLHGNPMEVAGFAADDSLLEVPYQQVGDEIAVLGDGRVDLLGHVPDGLQRIVSHRLADADGPGRLVGYDALGRLVLADLAGTRLAEYEPRPSTVTSTFVGAGERFAALSLIDHYHVSGNVVALAEVTHSVAGGDVMDQVERSYELVSLDDDGTVDVAEMVRGPAATTLYGPQLAATTGTAYWVEAGALWALGRGERKRRIRSDIAFADGGRVAPPSWR